MKHKICVMTATRAEYGLLRNVIRKLNKSYDVRLVVTGAHLSCDFGNTVKEIEEDSIQIDERLDILSGQDTPLGISETMAQALVKFSEYFQRTQPELLIVLGDRYETLAVCISAMLTGIPIAHIHGGETTQGAIDECIRHSVSKMSILHFVSCEDYRRRVIQLGEEPERVFCVGGLGVENIRQQPLLSKEELSKSIGFSLEKPYAVVTFHPVTLEKGTAQVQVRELAEVIKEYTSMNFIITKANADEGGRGINEFWEKEFNGHSHILLTDSLGTQRYLSALRYAEMVIGNSSSGILEAPSFQIPTINIGDRQKGRIQASSVINCKPAKAEIEAAIRLACTEEFRRQLADVKNPYEKEGTSDVICAKIDDYFKKAVSLKKRFYDLPKEVVL